MGGHLINLECSKYNVDLSAGPDIVKSLYGILTIYCEIFSVCGLVLHIYIILCYIFSRKGDPFTSDQCLIMGISIGCCISCLSSIILSINEKFISENDTAHFIIDKILSHVIVDSMHFITLFLALFRLGLIQI